MVRGGVWHREQRELSHVEKGQCLWLSTWDSFQMVMGIRKE
jgi:hypothetical protein